MSDRCDSERSGKGAPGFDEIYAAYGARVYRFCQRLCRLGLKYAEYVIGGNGMHVRPRKGSRRAQGCGRYLAGCFGGFGPRPT